MRETLNRAVGAGRRNGLALLACCALLGLTTDAHAQGVTTGSINGMVVDAQKEPVAGASVIAVHEPSGTNYEATTRRGRTIFDPQHARRRSLHRRRHLRRHRHGLRAADADRCHGQPWRRNRPADCGSLNRGAGDGDRHGAVSDTIFSSARTGAATSVEPRGSSQPCRRSRDDSTTLRGSRRRRAACRSVVRTIVSTTSRWTARISTTPLAWQARQANAQASRRSLSSHRTGPGQRRALRRAARQLRRRRHQHRDPEWNESVEGLGLSPVPQRGLRWHRSRKPAVQSRDLQLPQHRRHGRADPSSRASCLRLASTRMKTIPAAHHVPGQCRQRGCRRQYRLASSPRTSLKSVRACAAARTTRPGRSKTSTT